MKTNWHSIKIDQVLKELNVKELGLSSEEAASRFKTYGSNSLPQKEPTHWLKVLISQVKSPLIFILIFASLIELLFQGYVDSAVIAVAVLINVLIGFIQEFKAERALHELKNYISYNSKVYRDGKLTQIPSEELTVGDVVVVEAGDRIPADGRLIKLNLLQVNEAQLTGESLPVQKNLDLALEETSLGDRKCMVYAGSNVSAGRGEFIVTEIGKSTEIGEVAHLIAETKENSTPLQIKIAQLGRFLSYLVLAIALLIFIEGQIKGLSALEMFETAVAVAVAAIPEGLAISITVILALGMRSILKNKSLVRSLLATETLGSTSVICSDKTGTLTLGVMQATNYALPDGEVMKLSEKMSQQAMELFESATLCSDAFKKVDSYNKEVFWVGDTTETAILSAAERYGISKEELEIKFPRKDTIPFNSIDKYMVTLNEKGDKNEINVKGAVEQLLARSSRVLINGASEKISTMYKKQILSQMEKMTVAGLRVLGVAKGESSSNKLDNESATDLVFYGIIGLMDPLRQESKSMIQLTKRAGIKTVIITGDHRLTVSTIAKELGYKITPQNVLEGTDLDAMSDAELYARVSEIDVYARVSPRHKIRIVDAWKRRGEVVAMLGDGVNDAPALKAADIGVVVGSGTDVAKQTADLVLLDDNFKTVVMAIRQGRMIMDNIRKVAAYMLTGTFTEVILISLALFFSVPLPLTALQILYINMVTDSLPSFGLAMEGGEDSVMSRMPYKKDNPIFSPRMKWLIGSSVLLSDLGMFAFYWYLYKNGASVEYIQTLFFMMIGVSSLIYAYAFRSLRKNSISKGLFSNKFLNITILAGLVVQIVPLFIPVLTNALGLVPLKPVDWVVIFVASIIKIYIIESVKLISLKVKYYVNPAT